MKKSVVAAVLAVSVLFTACSKKNSETSSESETTGSSSETSATSSETESESSSETETETTSAPVYVTEEDIPAFEPVASFDVAAKKEIGYVDYMNRIKEVFVFIPHDDTVGNSWNCIEFYRAKYSIPKITNGKYLDLNKQLEQDFNELNPDIESSYKKREESFLKKPESDVQYDEDALTDIIRCDEKICTVLYRQPFARWAYDTTVVNYDAKSGRKILLEDVVKDVDAFYEMAADQAVRRAKIHGDTDVEKKIMIKALKEQEWQFAIDYNGVNLYAYPRAYPYFDSPIRISYIGHEKVFDGSYFDSLPKDYCIHLNNAATFYWDLDGDSKTESVRLRIIPSMELYEQDSFSILIDDREYSFDPSDMGLSEVWINSMMYVHVHDRDFLYLGFSGADSMYFYEVFEITGGEAKYIGTMPEELKVEDQCFDPNHAELLKLVYAIGRYWVEAEYSFNEMGIPETESAMRNMYPRYDGLFYPCMKKTMTFDRVDPETYEKTGTVKLKPGTSLSPVATDHVNGFMDTGTAIMEVLDRDSDERILVRFDLTDAEDPSTVKINGEDLQDIFVCAYIGE